MNREEIIAEMKKANDEIAGIIVERKDKKTGKVTRKNYAMVAERVKAFRKIWPEGVIKTEIIEDDGERVTFKAEVYSERDTLLATGHAFELKTTSYINQTSYIENCETSAVGRALGFLGIGCDEIASADELANALQAQDDAKRSQMESEKLNPIEAASFEVHLKDNGVDPDKVLDYYHIDTFEKLTYKSWRSILDNMKKAKEVWGYEPSHVARSAD